MARDDNDLLREGSLPWDPGEGLMAVNPDGSPVTEWPDPIPLRSHISATPFPVDTLPPLLRDWAMANAHELQCPVDLPANLALGAISCACGGWLNVQVRKNWNEPTNLFLAIALRSGEKKTPAFSRAIRPIRKFEIAEAERLAEVIAKFHTKRSYHEEREKMLKKQLSKADSAKLKELETEISEHLVALQKLPIAHAPRYSADDITQEQLGVLMQANGERMGLFSDEGGLFRLMMGYYNDGKANLDIYLKSFSGESVTVDRVSRDPVFLVRPSLTICLAVQPAVIESLGERPEMRNLGMLARFLLCIPESLVGRRDHSAEPAAEELLERYNNLIKRLLQQSRLNEQLELPQPRTLSLCPEGYQVLVDAQQEIEDRLAIGGDLFPYADWMNKLAGRIVRIAALLHVVWEVEDNQQISVIPVERVRHAKRLHDYFLQHALIGLDMLGADPVVSAAEHLLAWGKRQPQLVFTKRDAHVGCRALFPRAKDLEAPLELLVEKGWIRKVEQTGPKGAGRKSERYVIHPAQNTQNSQNPGESVDSVLSVDSVQGPANENPEQGREG